MREQRDTKQSVSMGRAAAGAGVAAGLLWSFGQMAYDTGPDLGRASTADIVRFYANQPATHRVGVTVAGMVFVLFLVYLAGLHRVLSTRQPTAATVALSAGIVVAAFYLLSATVATLPLSRQLGAMRPEQVDVLFGLRTLGQQLIFSMFPRVVFLAAASAAVLRARVLPRWIGMLGCAFASLALLGGLRFLFPLESALYGVLDGLAILSMYTFSLWVVASSLGLLVRSRRSAAPELAATHSGATSVG